RMNDKMFPRQFTEALRPGSYFRLIVEGSVGAGGEIRGVGGAGHGLTIRGVFCIYTPDREEIPPVPTVPPMFQDWKEGAADWLHKRKSRPTEAADPGCCET